jgi:lipopolysaccharide biosynthesis regulator YciM
MFRPRDQHHFVRGLLYRSRGDDDAAVAELEKALSVAASDFGRANLVLADIHMEHGRAAQAIAVLRPAARGWFLETTNLHISLTEMHERLAKAHEAAGMPDSASLHWRRVVRSWEAADAPMASRRTAARDALRG